MDIKETFICVNTFTSKKNGRSYFKLYTFDEDQGVVNENFIDENMYRRAIIIFSVFNYTHASRVAHSHHIGRVVDKIEKY